MEKELLNRYFTNNADSEEQKIVLSWLQNPLNQQEVLAFIESSWRDENIQPEKVASFNKLFEKARSGDYEVTVDFKAGSRRWLWTAAAACLVFLVAGAWLGYSLKKPATVPQDDWALMTATTGKGERTKLLLSDGSEVYLNPESKISFPQNLEIQQVVYLEGEANFNFKNNKKPVVIKTKELITTVKGSKCNISSFSGDSLVKISVEEGKAEIRSNESSEGFGPLLKLRIPARDSAKTKEKTDSLPKTMPLIKLRPVTVKQNESMVFDKVSNKVDIEHCNDCKEKE